MKIDTIRVTNPYLRLPRACYAFAQPQPLKSPYLIHANTDVAGMLGIDADELQRERFVEYLNGARFFKGSRPFAMAYAGHQFGYFVERLGDGRVTNIGTIGQWHMQLKGSGQTAYSRHGDGRAVLRSTIREYLASEALHALGIPTTRALAMIGSKQQVYRDMDWEEGAILCRISPSWIRFGTFEYCTRQKAYAELEALGYYAVSENFPAFASQDDAIEKMYDKVVKRTAVLMAHWMAYGFTHGVMNTDNMSIAGLTIDFGPFGFLDAYDADYVSNRSDTYGRYRFKSQPAVAKWNLKALLDALVPIAKQDRLEDSLSRYWKLYNQSYAGFMACKLGLPSFGEQDDQDLLKRLLNVMQTLRIDYTRFFYLLRFYDGEREPLLDLGLSRGPLEDWFDRYDERIKDEPFSQRKKRMESVNPAYILRSHMIEEAVQAVQKGDKSLVAALFRVVRQPFIIHEGFESWAQATPKHLNNRRMSCSS